MWHNKNYYGIYCTYLHLFWIHINTSLNAANALYSTSLNSGIFVSSIICINRFEYNCDSSLKFPVYVFSLWIKTELVNVPKHVMRDNINASTLSCKARRKGFIESSSISILRTNMKCHTIFYEEISFFCKTNVWELKCISWS